MAATCLEERVVCVCHDVAKATEQWQAYSASGFCAESPHNHAAAGGILAAAILWLLRDNDEEGVRWALVALHAGGCHHTHLGPLSAAEHRGDLDALAASSQARSFFLCAQDGIASLLPAVAPSVLAQAWDAALEWRKGSRSLFWKEFADAVSRLDGDARTECFLRSRDLLGRLCWYDWQSAKVQSGCRVSMERLEDAFEGGRFSNRPARTYPPPSGALDRLRGELCREMVALVKSESNNFYFVDAPTGLGKTEAMLAAAEALVGVSGSGMNKVVYAVPQVSIADQIWDDYFQGADAAIWNYLRRERAPDADTAGSAATLDILSHPFCASYSLTTFNQVMFALCHPKRTLCVRGRGLRDAVVVMDEFHKLPTAVLPYFFRLAAAYAERANCRFIFGSATPLASAAYLGTVGWATLPQTVTGSMYQHPAVNGRREYRKVGRMDVEQAAEWVDGYHKGSDDSLLVVLNMVGSGTWQLRKRFLGGYQPWRSVARVRCRPKERFVVFLDGLTPPLIRRSLVRKCRKAMAKGIPVTLVTTQMVEVGVDLDFDAAFVDYQGLASLIQRGGRAGRNWCGAAPRVVYVFSLILADGDTSYQRLRRVRDKFDIRFQLRAFEREQKAEHRLERSQERFFERWASGKVLADSDLTAELLRVQKTVCAALCGADVMRRFFDDMGGVSTDWGLTFLNAQFVAELYAEGGGEEVILLESRAAWDELRKLEERFEAHPSAASVRELYGSVSQRRVRVFLPEVLEVSGLTEVGRLTCLGDVRCLAEVAGPKWI